MTDNIGLRTGAAANQAAEVLSGAWRLIADGKATAEQLVELHFTLAEGFFKNANTIQAASGVAQAFPGTTQASPAEAQGFAPQTATQGFSQQVSQAFTPANQPGPFEGGQPNVVQAPFGQQAPQQQGQNFQPAPGAQAQGGSKVDQEWMALFNDPNGFYDNRTSKRTPNSPDFRQKQGDIALWLNGKYGPAPQWVFDRLQGGGGPVQ